MTAAREYLRSHGIDLKLAAECGIRSDGLNLYFPYEADDGTRYERGKNMVDGITRQPAGRQLDTFWPLGKASSCPILLCEGEADTLAAATILDGSDHPALRYLCPVGIPGASAPAGRVAEQLKNASCSWVYIVLDGDEAGRKATKRIALALERVNKRAIPIDLPDGKDLSDCIVEQGEAAHDWLATIVADHEAHADADRLVVEDIRTRLAA